MNWNPIIKEKKLVLLNATGLAAYDKERCQYCGRYGCTDRGITRTSDNTPSVAFAEADMAANVLVSFATLVEDHKDRFNFQFVTLGENQCVRKLKRSNAETILERLALCGPDCSRNMDCATGGLWLSRMEDYHCPYRQDDMTCLVNNALDRSPLSCRPDKEGNVECAFHEEAYNSCFKKAEGQPCYDLKEKLGVTDEENDYLLLLAHRFNAAPCRHCDEATCKNEASLHFDGICTLKGLMAPCEQYESVSPDHAYTEGVCTYVRSMDGKDDRKIFNSSDYAFHLSKDERVTLCLACRISHSIARATGLKCLGVRRSTSKPFLNDKNPLAKNAIEIDYLYLTHPEDVAKYNPALFALAVYGALCKDCKGLGCEEIDECNIKL